MFLPTPAVPFVWFTDADVEIVGDDICSRCLRTIDEDHCAPTLFRDRGGAVACPATGEIHAAVDVARFHSECFEELVVLGILRLQ